MTTENIYQVCVGNNKIEFYSITPPVIEKDKLVCKQLIRKSSVMEEVLGEKLEVFYRTEFIQKDVQEDANLFQLTDGVEIKLLKLSTLNWWELTEKEATPLLKEKVLKHYQKIVPNLIQNVNQLTKQLQMIQGEENPRSSQKRKNDFLIP